MRATFVAVLLVGALTCFAFAQDASLRGAAVGSEATVDEAVKVYPITYTVDGLPVWTKSGKLDLGLLMQHIQLTVNPSSWTAAGGASAMGVSPNDNRLIISTTSANHNAIGALFKRLQR